MDTDDIVTQTRKSMIRRQATLFGGLLASLSAPVWAITFSIGTVEAQLDSTLSFSSEWGVQRPDGDLVGQAQGGRGWVSRRADGRSNFSRGDTFSKRFQGEHALQLHRGNTGVFLSGRYWYDFELKDEQPISDGGRRPLAQASGARMLEAYGYQHYQVAERPGTLRVGRQTLNWGEGLFIRQGLNVVSPHDLSAFHQPVTDIREGLLPVNMLQASQQLSDDLSLTAFYQLEWRPSLLENCGTFFAANSLAEGCDSAVLMHTGDDSLSLSRWSDDNARHDGQWGVSLHYFLPQLDTEVAAYAAHYHSRLPIVSGRVSPASGYYTEFPEAIRLYGLSFSTALSSVTRWQGELSYRPNAPLQINAWDLLYQADGVSVGDIHGYERKAVTQAQTGITHIIDGAMGASRLTLQGEVGWTHVAGLESKSVRRYGRDAVFGPAAAICPHQGCRNSGFVSSDAWGYRLRAVWDFQNVLPGLDLQPEASWAHDVKGYSPTLDAQFVEGRKAATLSLLARFQDTYSAKLAYTGFSGGRYSQLADRDFVSLTLGLHF